MPSSDALEETHRRPFSVTNAAVIAAEVRTGSSQMARFVKLSEIGWILASADKRADQFDSHAIAARV